MFKNQKLTLAYPFIFLCLFGIGSFIFGSSTTTVTSPNVIDYTMNSSDVVFLIICSAFVFLMTPGLSFFYGGMVSKKNVLSTLIKSFIATGVVTILWIFVGYSLAFGDSIFGIFGNPFTHAFFRGIVLDKAWVLAPTIPIVLFAMFQLKFAIITPALVVGGVAERIRFMGFLTFIVLFVLFVYAPIAHWTWHPNGILFKLGVIDFAGGTVVHISGGCAALAGAMVLKRRKAHVDGVKSEPANIPFVVLGTGLLWFGWFGFNAGSAMSPNKISVNALIVTNIASAVAGITWVLFDYMRKKKPSIMGFCIGAVVGLVAITPAAGFVSITHSVVIGIIAALVSNLAILGQSKSKIIDDTLDVFPCHGIGGIVGMVLTGVFASKQVNPDGPDGLLYGNTSLFFTQILGMLIVVAFSFSVSWLIFKLIHSMKLLRVSPDDEEKGLDITQHGEVYH